MIPIRGMHCDPDYADYDDYGPNNDPVVLLERLVDATMRNAEEITKWAEQDRLLVFGALPDIHHAWTKLGLVLSQFDKLPQGAE